MTESKDFEAPSAGAAPLPAADMAAKMVALLQVVVDSMHKLEYLEAQKAKALDEEFAAEAAKAEQRKAERRRHERLQIAALALQGLFANAQRNDAHWKECVSIAVEAADGLIARLDLGASASEPPKATP